MVVDQTTLDDNVVPWQVGVQSVLDVDLNVLENNSGQCSANSEQKG